MKCASCGREGGSSTYCRHCSAPLLAVCPQGHTSPPGSRFCGECQAPISVHPPAPGVMAGCLGRIFGWIAALGVLALAGHLMHFITWNRALGLLGLFGVRMSDIENLFTILVVVPGVAWIVSLMLPEPIGNSVRGGIGWAVRLVWAGLGKAVAGVARLTWHLAEGRPSQSGDRKGRKGEGP